MRKGKRAIPPQPEVPNQVHPPMKAAEGTICQPHKERIGREVPAYMVVAGTPMCRACWKNINPPVLPAFLAQKPVGAPSAHL
jgi:hypothetical protein